MRTIPVFAPIGGPSLSPNPMQLIQGSKFGFRILKYSGANEPLRIPGTGFTNVGAAAASAFVSDGPGVFPVLVEINRELDTQSDQGLLTTENPVGQSATLLVCDTGWQPVPCRYLRISNSQPFNFTTQANGWYVILLADTAEELNTNIIKSGYCDDGQWSTCAEFLAPIGASLPQTIQGQNGNGGAAVNWVAGLTKLTIENLGPNILSVALANFPSGFATVTALIAAAAYTIGPAVSGVPAKTLILENLGDGVTVMIGTVTLAQVPGAGTRVGKFFGPGYRGD